MKPLVLLAFVAVVFANQSSGRSDTAKDVCYYCKANVLKLYGVLNDTQIQQTIIQEAGIFCQLLQPPLKGQCTKAVDTVKGMKIIIVNPDNLRIDFLV